MASRNYAPLYDVAVDKHIMVTFDDWPSVIPDIYHVDNTKRRIVTHQGWSGYGPPTPRFPGEAIVQGEINEDYNKRFFMRSCGLGDALPIEDVDDDPTGMLTQGSAKIAGGLAKSFTDYAEQDAMDYLINGFSATAGTPDGVSLYSLSHPKSKTEPLTLYANRPTTGVDLSVSTLQSMITRLRTQKAPNGRPMRNKPRILWYNPTLDFTVQQILKQRLEPYTMDNNDNIIAKYGITPIETPFLQESGADSDAFGLVGHEHFLYWIWRNRPRTHTSFDAQTKCYLMFLDMRHAVGHSSWRGTDASPGA
jgi:hypothetical protein